MRILVKSRKWIEKRLDTDRIFCLKFNFISIFSSRDFSPLPDRHNILKLEFDDIAEADVSRKNEDGTSLIPFDRGHALRIVRFLEGIDRRKILVVHCDAGISRSGAVGQVLNEYFNRVVEDNPDDHAVFFRDNSDIVPNPLVAGIMREALAALRSESDNRASDAET